MKRGGWCREHKGTVKEEQGWRGVERQTETERQREGIRWTVGRQSKLRDKILGLAERELESER